MAVSIKLAEAGFCGGNPATIMALDADMVMAMMDYIAFKDDYERTWVELNRKEPD